MLREVLEGLGNTPKRLPCKYFYDARGAELFEEICRLDEYYLTRAEIEIMRAHASEMADCLGREVMLVEYGPGSGIKSRLLLDALVDPVAYVPVDLSGEMLEQCAKEYRSVEVLPVKADFTEDFTLPATSRLPRRRVAYFPGSTVGNLVHEETRRLLRRTVDRIGGLLIGIDLVKDPAVLEAAYDDARGVTAEFNLNILARINRELGADFDLAGFRHRARYDAQARRIEMDLISRSSQEVTVAGHTFTFAEGEAINTEYCHKYTVEQFADLARDSGLELRRCWRDTGERFGVLYFDPPGMG